MKCLKRMVSVLLMLALLLNVGLFAAAENGTTGVSGLTITTDMGSKTIHIQGTLPLDDPASLLILSPDFDGNFENLSKNPSLITGIDQIGTIDVTIPLGNIQKGKYTLSINKDMFVEQFYFFLDSYTINTGDRITLPITIRDCQKFSGMSGVIEYDDSLLTLESIAPAKNFLLQSQNDRFIALTGDGMGLDGDLVVGYAIFTAKSGLEDDVTTFVNIRTEQVYNEAREPVTVQLSPIEVIILGIPPMKGDVNLDGKVDITDAILLMQYISGNSTLNAKQLRAAEVTGDGQVDIADVIVIMQICLRQ